MKIKHHPAPAMLAAHAQGLLPTATSAALAAHVEACSYCQALCDELEQDAAKEQLGQSMALDDSLFDALLLRLDDAPADAAPAKEAPTAAQNQLTINGESFTLPRALRPLAGRVGSWRRLGSKVWSADVDLGEKAAKASFLYIDSHTRIPKHTHGGEELTLVLSGHIKDESGRYQEGDFTHLDQHHEHQPYTEDAPCLCLTVLTAPLVFTGPLGRLANPLLRLFF